MERDIPHRDIPGTFLIINLNTKYFNFILNNEISFQIMKFHSKYLFSISKNTFSFMFFKGFSNDDFKNCCYFLFNRFVFVIFFLFFF